MTREPKSFSESPDWPYLSFDEIRDIFTKNGSADPVMNAHRCAFRIARKLLGVDWCDKFFSEIGKRNRDITYFRPSIMENDEHGVWRQIRFAELLFNIQIVAGFGSRCKSWSAMEPEAIVAELESLYYMIACGHRATLQAEGGKPTCDFSVELSSGITCGWEAKAKVETTEFSPKQIARAVDDAKKQISTCIPNIILLRIPEKWTEIEGFSEKLEVAIDNIFRQSSRALAILLHWETWHAATCELGLSGMEFTNANWSQQTQDTRVIGNYKGFPEGWIRLDRL